VKMFRDMAMGKTADHASYISDFQKLRAEGKLNDTEYSMLAKSIPKVIPKNVNDERTDELPDFEELTEPAD
jgi:hypothetical protein